MTFRPHDFPTSRRPDPIKGTRAGNSRAALYRTILNKAWQNIEMYAITNAQKPNVQKPNRAKD